MSSSQGNNHTFIVEYAKSSRSSCKLTKKKIAAGALRFGVNMKSRNFDGMQTNWHNAREYLFAKKHKRKRPYSVDEIGGFETLRPEDQTKIEEWIEKYNKANNITAPQSPSNNKSPTAAAAATGVAKQDDDDDVNDEETKKKKAVLDQSAQIWKIRDATTTTTSKSKKNNSPLSAASIKLILEANGIPTSGVSPSDLVRILAETLWFGVPCKGNKTDGCCGSQPLSFCEKSCQYVCGAPLPWGNCPYTKPVEDVVCTPVVIPDSVCKEWVKTVTEICGKGFPPRTRLYTTKTNVVSSPSTNKRKRAPTSSTTDANKKQKSVRKPHLSRACVDPASGMDANHHVLDEAYKNKAGSAKPDPTEPFPIELYDTILCMTNLSAGTNSQYKLQILKEDTKDVFYLWRVWGRVGGDGGGGSKLQKCNTLEEAKTEFCDLFKKYTNNEWSDRKHFVKHPNKFFQLDVSYAATDDDDDDSGVANSGLKVKVIADDPNSKLSPRVQKVIAAIFDTGIAVNQLKRLNIDIAKMPLGKMTESQLKDAYSVLTKIDKLLTGNSSMSASAKTIRDGQLQQLSNQFYSKCPSTDPVLINTSEILKTKIQMVDELLDLQVSASVMGSTGSSSSSSKAPVDAAYEKLKTDLTPLDPTGEEYALLKKYVTNTRKASVSGGYSYNDWSGRGLRLLDAFRVKREGEGERFRPCKSLGNRRLLWHGSRITNYSGILSQGLRIAPPEAPASGYRFGKGVYFADLLGKSANYCRTNGSSEMLVMACDVALGTMFETPRDVYMEKPRAGTNSTHALSQIIPDPSMNVTLHEKGDALSTSPKSSGSNDERVLVPLGTAINNPALQTMSTSPGCDVSEFIVYDQSQVNIRYLLRLTTDKSTPAADASVGTMVGTQPLSTNPAIASTTAWAHSVAAKAAAQPVNANATSHSDDDTSDVDSDDGNNANVKKKPKMAAWAFIQMDPAKDTLPSVSGLQLMHSRTFVEGLRLTVVRGDITKSKTESIVVPTDSTLSLSGMVGEKVKAVAGAGLVSEIALLMGGGKASSSSSSSIVTLPSSFSRLDTGNGGMTIRELARAANVPYLTPYYLVIRKEDVSATKDVIVIEKANGRFRRGIDARTFIKMGTAKKVSISPAQIDSGVDVFVQSSSHNRKCPKGSSVLLETSTTAAPAPSAAAATTTTTALSSKPLQTSDVCTVGGHSLPSKHIVFVVSPIYSQQPSSHAAELELKKSVKNVLSECSKKALSTVTLPSIGSGRAGYDKGDAAKCIIEAIADYLEEATKKATSKPQSIREVCFCLFDDESIGAYIKGMATHDKKSGNK